MRAAPLDALSEADRAKLRRALPPESSEPMKAKLTERRFSDPGWVFERKLDGVRAMVHRHGEAVQLVSRTGHRLVSYPELNEALPAEEADDFVADGGIIAFEGSRTSFARPQGRMQIQDPERARRSGIPGFPYPSDLIYPHGADRTRRP